jgi:hypothetical protein
MPAGELPVRNSGKSPSFQMCRKWAQWLYTWRAPLCYGFHVDLQSGLATRFNKKTLHSPNKHNTEKLTFGIFLKGKGSHKGLFIQLESNNFEQMA